MANVRRNRRAAGRLTAGKTAETARRERLPRRVLSLLAEPLDPALISERVMAVCSSTSRAGPPSTRPTASSATTAGVRSWSAKRATAP